MPLVVIAQAAPNTAAVWIALIGSVTTVVTIIVTQRTAGRNRKEQTAKIDAVHVLVNDRLDRALKENKNLARSLVEVRKLLAKMMEEKQLKKSAAAKIATKAARKAARR